MESFHTCEFGSAMDLVLQCICMFSRSITAAQAPDPASPAVNTAAGGLESRENVYGV